MSNVVDFIMDEDDSGRHIRAATLEKLVEFCVDEFGKKFVFLLAPLMSYNEECFEVQSG